MCHTACLGSDDDVVVFGGSSNMRILMDSVCDGENDYFVKDLAVKFVLTAPFIVNVICELYF